MSLDQMKADLQKEEDNFTSQEESQSENEDPSDPSSGYDAETQRIIEANARVRGWRPEEEFTGPKGKWVDAATFLRRGEEFVSTLKNEITGLREELASFKGSQKKFEELHKSEIERKNKEIETLTRELRLRHSQAVREGEDDLAIDLEDQIQALKEEKNSLKNLDKGEEIKKPSSSEQDANKVILQEWIDDNNAWFQEDEKLRNYAVAYGERLIREGYPKRGRPYLDDIRKHMEENFPRRFAVQRQTASHAGSTNGGSNGNSSTSKATGKYTASQLPSEDRAIMRQLIDEGITTEEKFLKNYFSESSRHHRS